jgi:HEAT repeat protein
MYPPAHPAITATLERVVEITSSPRLAAPLRLTVLPDRLLLDERVTARPDAAVTELAELLHSHVIGALTVNAGGDVEAWRSFLELIGHTPDALRAEGGIARVWATRAGQHVELREIDYSRVLREKKEGGKAASWDRVIAACLQNDAFALDEQALQELIEIARSPEQLAELVTELERRATSDGNVGATAAALLRMLQSVVDAVAKSSPDGLEPVLKNMATAVGQLAPDTVVHLFSERGDVAERPRLMNALVSRMSDATIAQFVARNVIEPTTSTDRLAEAFQALVKDSQDRQRLLSLAHKDVAESPLGNTDGFEGVWDHVAEKLLTSYSDKSYVSDAYGRELSGARMRAIDVEEAADDPPERIAAWLSTVATTALRALDLALMLDVLRIEDSDDRWGEMMTPVVALIEDLLLVGDFGAAAQLVERLTREAASGESTTRRQYAVTAIDLLVAGPMMRNIVPHLTNIDEMQFEQVKTMCLSLGEVVVKPLAEALAAEERARPRQRLTAILLAFGGVGRRTAERLKGSPNAAVRRTAIYLLREFGGSDALPDLTELLNDSEAQVQREAIRAILNIGTEQSYEVLEQALTSGTDASRRTIMEVVSGVRDGRATPLLTYIVRHVSHRGPLGDVYLQALESLGTLRDPDAVPPLKEALYRGEWWAPRRNGILRSAAAQALARIGTPEAQAVLDEAASSAPRGVRAAVRPHLNAKRPRAREPRENL